MVVIQRSFLIRYKKIMYPKDPVSMEDLKKMYDENFSNAFKFFRNKGLEFLFLRGRLYFKKYRDKDLNKYALLIRAIFIILFLIPLVGISILLLLST